MRVRGNVRKRVWVWSLLLLTLMVGSVSAQREVDGWAFREGLSPAGWSATASVNPEEAAAGIDGDPGTVWTATMGVGDYYAVDLGEVYAVNRLEWHTASNFAHTYPQHFRVEVSLDGEAWTPVADREGMGAYLAGDEIIEDRVLQVVWPATEARYIRVVQTAAQEGPVELKVLSVWEEGMDVGLFIHNMAYFPRTVLVEAGTNLEWLQVDYAPHTVTHGDPLMSDVERLFDSSGGEWANQLTHGDSWRLHFEWVGEFEYFCLPHPNMLGWVRSVEL